MGKRPRKPSVEERRRMLVGMGLGVGALAFIGYKVATYDQYVSFQEAQKDPSLRQQFLDQRKSQFARPFVSRVSYVSQPVEQPNAGASIFDDLNNFGDRKPREVQVYPKAFEGPLSNEIDFLNVIVDHEIDGHARMSYDGLPVFSHLDFKVGENQYHNSIKDVCELIAYGYQLNRAKAKGASEKHIAENFGTYCTHYASLLKTSPAGLKDEKLLEKALVSLYQDAFLQTTQKDKPLITQRGDRHYWQLENGAQMLLPNAVSDRIKMGKK